ELITVSSSFYGDEFE
ncbi:unnamed protein product, partial [Rotaria sordida]